MRNVYAMANLRISPKEKASPTDVLRGIIKARGESPAKYLKRKAVSGIDSVYHEDEAGIYAIAVWEDLWNGVVETLSESLGDG